MGDVTLATICLTLVAIITMLLVPGATETIVIPIVTCIGGFVTGRITKKKGGMDGQD